MARLTPQRRILVTTFNTALATAAVTATAAGWAVFGMADNSSAATAPAGQLSAQDAPIAQQSPPSEQPFFAPRRHHHGEFESREGFGSGEGSGQSQMPFFGEGSAPSGDSGQSQTPSFGGSSSQGGSQFRQPITRSRSSR